jgi:phage major head subunit gpT-like protein
MSFAWIGRLDKMRLWLGPRITHEPAPQTYTVTPQPFELTEAIDRFKLDDDMMGVYYRTLPEMALQAKRWPDFQMRDMLRNQGAWTGLPQNGLDGLTYFNTAHPVDLYNSGAGTYSNDFTGGGANVAYKNAAGGTVNVLTGGAFSPTALATVVEYMMQLKAEDGEPVGVTPNKLLVPPQLRLESELVVKSTFFAPPAWGTIASQVGAADNPLARFGLEPEVWELLAGDSSTWYVQDTTKAFRPMLWILRYAPVAAYRIAETDPVVFDSHKYLYGYWARGCPAWGFSWLMVRSGP